MSSWSLYFFHLQSGEFNQLQLFFWMVTRLAAIKGRDQIRKVYKAVRHLINMLVNVWSEDVSQEQVPQAEGAPSSRM